MLDTVRYVAGFWFGAHDQSVYLINKNRPSWQKGKLNAIGGHIEPNESIIDAMIREFHEEAGIHYRGWAHVCRLQGDGFSVDFFRNIGLIDLPDAIHYKDIPTTQTDEVIEKIDLSQPLPTNIIPNLNWLIPMCNPNCQHDWPYLIREKCIYAETV